MQKSFRFRFGVQLTAFLLVFVLAACNTDDPENPLSQIVPSFRVNIGNGTNYNTPAAAYRYDSITNHTFILATPRVGIPDFSLTFPGRIDTAQGKTFTFGLTQNLSLQATGTYQMGSVTSLDSTYTFVSGTLTVSRSGNSVDGTFSGQGRNILNDSLSFSGGEFRNVPSTN